MFLEAAAQRLQSLLPELKVQDMCQITFAYAYYRHMPSNGLLDRMALQFQQLRPPAEHYQACQMCRAYRSLGLHPDVDLYRGC